MLNKALRDISGLNFTKIPIPKNTGRPFVLNKVPTGVEIEAEGFVLNKVDHIPIPGNWTLVSDGSLKAFGVELKMKSPRCGTGLKRSLIALEDYCKKVEETLGHPIQYNWRTSTHIHLDCSSLSLRSLGSILAVYMIFEPILFQYCGTYRQNNIFCIPFYKNTDFIKIVANLVHYERKEFNTSNKYSSVNIGSLIKFGSIEFRAFRGTHNYEELKTWIDILYCIRKYGMKLASSKEIYDLPSLFSERGVNNIGKSVFGKYWNILNQYCNKCEIYDGIKSAQDLIFYPYLNF